MSSAMHRDIILTLSSFKQAAAQRLHAAAHSLQASMHAESVSCDMVVSFYVVAGDRQRGTMESPRLARPDGSRVYEKTFAQPLGADRYDGEIDVD
ncbi:hypothetical protein A9977_00190 [Variovorax sp. UMC13]|nr:hypothetical protein [Variovorax sp. UMC13]